MRRAALAAVLVLLATACSSDLGTAVPGCVEARAANGAHLIQHQAVPGAALVPCIRQLPPGWTYNDLVPERGRSRFEFDSDRVGAGFLEVTFEESCDTGDAVLQPTDEPGTQLLVAVIEEPSTTAPVVVVPAGERHVIYAQGLLIEMSDVEVQGRTLVARIDDTVDPFEARIERHLQAGVPVLSVADFDVNNKTVSLHLPGRGPILQVTLDQALEEIEEITDEMRYRARWHYLLDGACTTYEFDAKGRGAASVAADAESALGFFDVSLVIQFLNDEELPIGAER